MILLQLKDYIRQHQHVSLKNIAHHFDITEDTAQGLLKPLLQQGHVLAVYMDSPGCQSGHCTTGGCSSSSPTDDGMPHYQWSARKLKPIQVAIQVQNH